MSVLYHNINPCATRKLLLKHGALVNAYDKGIWTALIECIRYGKEELAELLLANGAHVDGKPGGDDSAFDSNPDLKGKLQEIPLVGCGRGPWNEELI